MIIKYQIRTTGEKCEDVSWPLHHRPDKVIKDVHLQFTQSVFSPLKPGCWANTAIFQQLVGYFLPYWRGNFLCSSSGSCLLPLCSIREEGRGKRATAILLDKIKVFFARTSCHPFPSKWYIFLLQPPKWPCLCGPVRQRGRVGEEDWKWIWSLSVDAGKHTQRRRQRRAGKSDKESCSGFIFNLLHPSGRHSGTLHLINQTFRPDLGWQHYKTGKKHTHSK